MRVVILSRHPRPAPWRVVAWDGETPADWCTELEGADAVINLAGRSVNCRYTPANRLLRWGFGGQAGTGRQYVSWIHDRDFTRAILWLIEQDGFEGAVNVAAPNPVPNAEFMRALRAAWGIRFGLPASTWMLEIGAVLIRTETELILKSRRVIPGRLLEAGFAFQFPAWSEAARDLCERHRRLLAR